MATQQRSEKKPLSWEDCLAVALNPRRVGDAWTFGNSRLPLYIGFQNLASSATLEEVTQWFEGITEHQIKEALAHQARMLEEDRIEEHRIRGILPDEDSPGPQCPHRLRRALSEHEARTAAYLDWSELENGELLEAVASHGYHLGITGDQGISNEQNLLPPRRARNQFRQLQRPSLPGPDYLAELG